jgi:hypothetical protein
MILAIEADGAGYRDSGSVRDRDRLRKEHLERLGWRVHRLWSTAWFTDAAGELAKLRSAFDSAVGAAPPPPAEAPPPPTAEAPPPPTADAAPPPPPADATQAGARDIRVIPLGPGERPRLIAPAAKALPSPDRAGPTAPPPSSAAEPAG